MDFLSELNTVFASMLLFLLLFALLLISFVLYLSPKCPCCGKKRTLKSLSEGTIEVTYCDNCKHEVSRIPKDNYVVDPYAGDRYDGDDKYKFGG